MHVCMGVYRGPLALPPAGPPLAWSRGPCSQAPGSEALLGPLDVLLARLVYFPAAPQPILDSTPGGEGLPLGIQWGFVGGMVASRQDASLSLHLSG